MFGIGKEEFTVQINDIRAFLIANANAPLDPERYRRWLDMPDAWAFLAESIDGDVPAYVSVDRFYLYSAVVARRELAKRPVSDLHKWNMKPSAGWGFSQKWDHTIGEERKYLVNPLESAEPHVLKGAEPLLFLRSVYGSPDSDYVELNQRFAHILNIHLRQDKSAYCQVDANGDLEPVVITHRDRKGSVCTVTRDALDFYLYLTDSVLVRVFEVQRYRQAPPSGGRKRRRQQPQYVSRRDDLHARVLRSGAGTDTESASIRGFQVIQRATSDADMMRRVHGESTLPREFATFIALDWKHQAVGECSCDPDQFGNYFTPLHLPVGLSPAFFTPDVLTKYKQDADNYTLQPRLITCRATWSLRYDINAAGQVYVYLVDLGRLPYSEQLYWKSCNELPREGLPERAYSDDILRNWFGQPDALEALKRELLAFPPTHQRGLEVAIWSFSEDDRERNFSSLTGVVTEALKEWDDQVLALAKILIDGLQKSPLRALALSLGEDADTVGKTGSVTLLRRCLELGGVDDDIIDETVKPLLEVQDLRSNNGVAYPGTRPTGDLRRQYDTLLNKCAAAVATLTTLVRTGTFDIA